MLTQTVSYFDYDDKPQTETLYFNLTRTEAITNLPDLVPRMEAWLLSVKGTDEAPEPERQMTTEEIKELLNVMNILVANAYGVRSEDGKRFAKSPELYKAFTETAVYDAFFFGMFEDPTKATTFMQKILPKAITDSPEFKDALAAREVTTVELPQPVATTIDIPEDEAQPALTREEIMKAYADRRK